MKVNKCTSPVELSCVKDLLTITLFGKKFTRQKNNLH